MSKVSVIIPVYNAARALGECLDSVVGQTYADLEILLVDDGSTDKSGSICDSYAEKDSRIQVFHNENHGPSYTRNYGIEKSGGDYIMFADSDDRLEPDAVELCVEGMEKHGVELVFGGYGKFNDGRKKDFDTRSVIPAGSTETSVVFNSRSEVAALFAQPRTSLSAVAVWAKLYRADIIKNNNIRFPLNVSYEEDCCFNLQYYRCISSAYGFDKPIYHYRQCAQSLSKSYDLSKFRSLVDGYLGRCELFRELGMENRIVSLKNILVLVLITTYQKIERSAISRKEKIRNYTAIANMPEVQDAVSSATEIPDKRLYRLALAATARGNGRMIWLWMRLWQKRNELKAKLKNAKAKKKK